MRKQAYISTIGPSFLLANYGSFFQHLCLRRFLEKRGYKVARWRSYDQSLSEVEWIKSRIMHLFYRFYWVFHLPAGFEELRDGLLDTDRMIAKFRKSYRRMIGPLNEPNEIRPGDLCVLGSDQVLGWESEVWFPEVNDCTKVIYAGSADWKVTHEDKAWYAEARRLFPGFKGVGLREQAGVELVNDLAIPGVKAVQVVDPVLLTESKDFCALASPRKIFKRPTLFCYLVNIKCREALNLPILEEVARQFNCDLKIVGIQGAMGYIPRKYRLVLAPEDFLAAYRDAAYVITNSFHGSVFAMHFHKQFLSVKQISPTGQDQNLRQRELMCWTGLNAWYRAFDEGQAVLKDALMKPIEYKVVDLEVGRRRESSRTWMEEMINCG